MIDIRIHKKNSCEQCLKIFIYYIIITEPVQTIETLIQKRNFVKITVPVKTFIDFLNNNKQIYFLCLYL